MSHTDDFVFQYLLTLNFLHWPFRHLPRDKSLEQEFIKLGQKEYAIEHDPKFQEIMRHTLRPFTNSVWKQLDLGELRDELRRFSIVGQEILENFPDVSSADISPIIQLIPEPVDRFNAYEHLYFFSENGATYYWGVLYRKQKKLKLLIPFCSARNKSYPFWPEKIPLIFYNTQFVEQAHAVILTDDIAGADFYQTQLLRSGNSDLAWISWYGDLTRYPWEQLKKKKIYFFMEQHSGLSYEQMLEAAIRVQEQLRAVGGPELSLIFMNSADIPEALPGRENIPLIVDLEKWRHWVIERSTQRVDPFGYFRNQVAPRINRPTQFDISPFIVHGNRILITGSGSSKELFLLALLVPFCNNSFSKSQKGTTLFIRNDQSPLYDWIDALRLNHDVNVRHLDPRELPIRITDICPLLVDEMLNISELKTSSISDCQKLLALIEQSTQTVKNGMPKILVIDSLNSFLLKVLKQTLLFLDTLRDHGWTVIFVESRSTSYIKALRCEQEIVIEPSAECTGNEVICSAEIPLYGKIKKFYRINLLDGSEPILKESSYNRKSPGLLRPRPQLVMELMKLWRAGAKGKEIAERLQISESMVKKLKREYGFSQPRSRPDLNPSGNNYYGPNFMPPRPE